MFYRKAIVIREFMNQHTGVRRDLPNPWIISYIS